MSVAVLGALKERLGDGVLTHHAHRGDETALVAPHRLVEACQFLRDDRALSLRVLMDLTAVDWPQRELRFDVVYHLYSPSLRHRIRLKVQLADVEDGAPEIDSVTSLWASANWYEREAWDLYGIRFRGHPDLRRVLLYQEFEGHPLRKDYPKEQRQPLARRTRLPHPSSDNRDAE
jgi:NADH-quinone oxidoreductase subunit C